MKKTKTLLSCLLAMIMVIVSMNFTAFAAVSGAGESSETPMTLSSAAEGKLELRNVDTGDVFNAFAVMTVTYNDATNDMAYVPDTAFDTFLKNQNVVAGVNDFETYQNLDTTTDAEKIKTILGAYAATVKDTTPKFTVNGTTETTVKPIGQYILLAQSSTGAKVFQVMTASWSVTNDNGTYKYNEKVTIDVKVSEPSIEKTVDVESVSIGDPVNFAIKATVPTYPVNATNRTFKITDTLSNSGLAIDINSIVVKGVATDGTATQLANTAYTVTANGTLGFTVDFTNFDLIAGYSDITVDYTAIAMKDIVAVTTTANAAKLEFSNSPYGDANSTTTVTPDSEVKVHTYGADIVVVDSADNTVKLGAGVQFVLQDADGNELKFTYDATTKQYVYDSVNGTTVLETKDADSLVSVRGLKLGTYKLVETKTVAEYSLPTVDVPFTLVDTNPDGILDDDTDNILDVQVENAKINMVLPSTGGIGTYIFVVVGLGIMIAACTALIVVKKKANNA